MDVANIWLNATLVIVFLITIAILANPRLTKSASWHATLTPLSSIIGSGFLVMAPLLASIVGIYAPIAVLAIVIFAYMVGGVIRFNILEVEELIHKPTTPGYIRKIEFISAISISFAYVIAIVFYLALLSQFLLDYLGYTNIVLEQLFTTTVIVFIAIFGYLKGLNGLEKLELWSMTIQLSIVASFLLAIFYFAYIFFISDTDLILQRYDKDITEQIQELAGILLIVQGFETSRFLGQKYSPKMRAHTMKRAQIISGVLYVVSVLALMPLITHLDLAHIHLSKIVGAGGLIAVVLPIMIMVSAVSSQFSASVADMGGAGGLFNENTNNKISVNVSYIIVSVIAIILVWSTNIFDIITLASRAFAAYYLLQTVIALYFSFKKGSNSSIYQKISFIIIFYILAFVVVFSVSVE